MLRLNHGAISPHQCEDKLLPTLASFSRDRADLSVMSTRCLHTCFLFSFFFPLQWLLVPAGYIGSDAAQEGVEVAIDPVELRHKTSRRSQKSVLLRVRQSTDVFSGYGRCLDTTTDFWNYPPKSGENLGKNKEHLHVALLLLIHKICL